MARAMRQILVPVILVTSDWSAIYLFVMERMKATYRCVVVMVPVLLLTHACVHRDTQILHVKHTSAQELYTPTPLYVGGMGLVLSRIAALVFRGMREMNVQQQFAMD